MQAESLAKSSAMNHCQRCDCADNDDSVWEEYTAHTESLPLLMEEQLQREGVT